MRDRTAQMWHPEAKARFDHYMAHDPDVRAWAQDYVKRHGYPAPSPDEYELDYEKAWLAGEKPRRDASGVWVWPAAEGVTDQLDPAAVADPQMRGDYTNALIKRDAAWEARNPLASIERPYLYGADKLDENKFR